MRGPPRKPCTCCGYDSLKSGDYYVCTARFDYARSYAKLCLDCAYKELCVEETGGSEEESAQVEEEAEDEEGLDKEEEHAGLAARGADFLAARHERQADDEREEYEEEE